MVYTEGVAVSYGIDYLQKNGSHQVVVANVPFPSHYHIEEIAAGKVVHDDERVVTLLKDTVNGRYAWMARCQGMQDNLSALKMSSSRVHFSPVEALDGDVGVCAAYRIILNAVRKRVVTR